MRIHYQEFKKNLALAIPIMIGGLGHVLFSLVDNLMVGNILGAEKLAGVSLANAVFFIIIVLVIGSSTIITPLIAEAHAQKDQEKMISVFKHSVLFVLGLSTIAYFLLLISPYFLALLPIASLEVKEIASIYLTTRSSSVIALGFFLILDRLAEGLSYTKGVMYAVLISNVINAFLNYLLIEGNFGFSALGIQGAGIATLITSFCMTLLTYFFVVRVKRVRIILHTFSFKNIKWQKIKKIATLGLPAGAHLFAEASAFQVATFICSLISTAAVAAHQIVLTLTTVPFMILLGIGIANSVRVANYLGTQEYQKLQIAMRISAIVSILFMGIVSGVYLIFRQDIPLYFIRKKTLLDSEGLLLLDSQTAEIAAQLIIMAAVFSIADGIQMIFTTGLRGMKDTKIPSLIAIVAYVLICIPLGYYLGISKNMGAFGVWIGLALGLNITAISLWMRYRIVIRKLLIKQKI